MRQQVRTALQQIYKTSGDALYQLSDYLDEPLAPEEEIESWPLFAREQEWGGGIWCGVEDCVLMAENSEIGDFRERESFTLAELRQAIGDHIAAKKEREADE